jgi:hypothetical protein
MINVKRFSRSKEPDEQINLEVSEPEPTIKKTRGRKKKEVIIEEPIVEPDPEPEEVKIEIPELEEPEPDEVVEFDNDFLNELNSVNFKDEQVIEQEQKQNNKQKKEQIKLEKELIKLETLRKREEAKQNKLLQIENKPKKNDDLIYSDSPTEILGPEKRILLNKVKQYKNLFPEELKGFKIKVNPSVVELKSYLDEMEIIVNTSNVDNFITESILQCLKLAEGVSSYTENYNITGMSDLLKSNKDFHKLCKQLYIKYNTFDNIPPEYQLIMMVSTTAYICKMKNSKKKEIQNYLNEEINI